MRRDSATVPLLSQAHLLRATSSTLPTFDSQRFKADSVALPCSAIFSFGNLPALHQGWIRELCRRRPRIVTSRSLSVVGTPSSFALPAGDATPLYRSMQEIRIGKIRVFISRRRAWFES